MKEDMKKQAMKNNKNDFFIEIAGYAKEELEEPKAQKDKPKAKPVKKAVSTNKTDRPKPV